MVRKKKVGDKEAFILLFLLLTALKENQIVNERKENRSVAREQGCKEEVTATGLHKRGF